MIGRMGRGGFSLIELIICIGIIAVLIGLTLPALGKAREMSKQARNAMQMRNAATGVFAYLGDWADVYPIAEPGVNGSMLRWDRPLIASGVFPNAQSIDPEGVRLTGSTRIALSGCMFHPAAMMEPGATVPIGFAETSPIRQTDVLFPSSKGVLWQWLHIIGERHVFWTIYDLQVETPIALGDGSVQSKAARSIEIRETFIENWVGHPVMSTWGGVRGIDRLR